MKILQISDLHISSKLDEEKTFEIIKKFVNELKPRLLKDDNLVVCICGDIFDCGDSTQFDKAYKIINYISSLLKVICNLKMLFVPGNHDRCSDDNFNAFNKLIKDFSCTIVDYSKESVSCIELNGYNFILCNSAEQTMEYGTHNIITKMNNDNSLPSIYVVHHTFMSENKNDISAIRDAYSFFDNLNYNTIAILHGHTHGYKAITLEKNCKIIGVGPFLKEEKDINKQVNLIEVSNYGVKSIFNLRYDKDLNGVTEIPLFECAQNEYEEDSIKFMYNKLVEDVKSMGMVTNLHIKLQLLFEQFKTEIEENFKYELCLAEEWQSCKVPKTLFYNHGQYMKYKDDHAIKYIIEELSKKSTSNRAIIPLINFSDVSNSGDDFLPSFDVVQFGFDSDTKEKLFVTLYMRALEVNHFLKINICELFFLCKTIKDSIRSVKYIDLNIFSFRAQYKEHYGCFKRSQLDQNYSADFSLIIQENNFDELIEMLEEKKNLSETVIIDTGIVELNQAITSLKKRHPEKDWTDWVKHINNIKECQTNLFETRAKTSNYLELKDCEKKLEDSFDSLKNYIRSLQNGVI